MSLFSNDEVGTREDLLEEIRNVYTYKHLELKLYINEQYYIFFTFYEHPMCGEGMYVISLKDKKNKISCYLRSDGPCDNGCPCFFSDEVLAIIILITKNPKNKFNLIQIICCLGLIHRFDEDLIEDINNYFDVDLKKTKNIWDNMIQENTLTHRSLNREPFPHDLNYMYPFPKIIKSRKIKGCIDGLECIIDQVYGRIIVDEECCYIDSVRSRCSPWNHEQKVTFAFFSKFLLSQ